MTTNFIQKVMLENIQQWMIMIVYKFNPETDDKKHPIMDKNCYIQYWMIKTIHYWMIIDDISHSIEKVIQ